MRRKRRKLQVDTFPFLAVLLCAMGSLILLLLVLDRRAKLVAQAKAKQALEEVQSEQKKKHDEIIAARQAEWERRKHALHQQLLRQQEKVMAELQRIHLQKQQAEEQLQKKQTLIARLSRQMQHEQTSVNDLRRQKEQRQKLLADSKTAAAAVQQKINQWAEELEQLELTLRDVKALQKRSGNAYSLVPYRGKNTDDRQPIYAECTAQGLIFHPDGKGLHGPDFTPLSVRRELERRIDVASAAEKKSKFYLLLLVRPDGVENYYNVQSALAGLSIDFGYEFIEQDWQLDFSHGNKPLPAAPVVAAAPSEPAPPGKPPKGFRADLGLSEDDTLDGSKVGNAHQGGNGDNETPLPYHGTDGPFLPVWKPYRGNGLLGGRVELGQPEVVPGAGKFPAGGHADGKEKIPPTPGNWQAPGEKSQHAKKEPRGQPPKEKDKNAHPWRAGEKNQQSPGSGSEPGVGFPSILGEKKPQHRPPSPLHFFTGNRDWYIPVECKAGEVVLPLSRERFALDALTKSPKDNPLAQSVRETIARRQARLRPGEPPYRPILRFEVWPDGLRTYHVIYPLLEELRLPMIRHNVPLQEPSLADYFRR